MTIFPICPTGQSETVQTGASTAVVMQQDTEWDVGHLTATVSLCINTTFINPQYCTL